MRYVKNTFQLGNSSTIGASFLTKKVAVDEDATVRLQIWDTAGQERFRSMAPMYYRSANCGIICYDVTSLDSFYAMNSWLVEIQENQLVADDLMIFIVGTKLDLVEENPSLRQVPYEDCVAYAARVLSKTRKKPYESTSPSSCTQSRSSSHYRSNTSSFPQRSSGNRPLNRSSQSNISINARNKLGTPRSSRNPRRTHNHQNALSRRNSATPVLEYSDLSTSYINRKSNSVSPNTRNRQHPCGTYSPSSNFDDSENIEVPEYFVEYDKSKNANRQDTSSPKSNSSDSQRRLRNGTANTLEIDNSINRNKNKSPPSTHSSQTDDTDSQDNNDEDEPTESELEFAASFCYEISAKDNQGINEVFDAITRRLLQQHYQKAYREIYEHGQNYENEYQRGNTVNLDDPNEGQGLNGTSKCC